MSEQAKERGKSSDPADYLHEVYPGMVEEGKVIVPPISVLLLKGHPQHGWLILNIEGKGWMTMADLKPLVPLLRG
jgi:hypothetical protein